MTNNKTNKHKRNQYSPEFKDQALAKASVCGVAQTARDLGISESLLYSWRAKQIKGGSSLEHQKIHSAELAQLKRDVKRLSEENAFLKKAAAYFAKDPK